MQITTIYYEKAFPLAPYLNEKVGVSIGILPEESPELAIQIAKDFVNKHGNKLVEQHPEHITYRAANVFHPNEVARDPHASAIADKEFEDFKKELDAILSREEAEEFLNKSSFKFSIEAKKLVEQKPFKHG